MDKNKIIEAAAKLVAKGAYDKAIKEYQKILNADPKDTRALQKLGELYQKKNDNVQAAHFFTKVAESYSGEGFFLKAVALYKQVLKLSPGLLEVNLKLAELHQQLQLMSEAASYYQLVANQYEQAGDVKQSLNIFKKLVDLSPENVTSRVKLAELYVRENMKTEAAEEFRRAIEYLQKHKRQDDVQRVMERLATLEPNNVELARELASLYLALGDAKRALAKLQVCFNADPKDVQTLALLAGAFQDIGQTGKAVSIYREMVKVFTERGQLSEANEVRARIQQLEPADAAPAGTESPSGNVAPGTPVPLRVTPGLAPTQNEPSGDPFARILTETDVYLKYGLHDRALEHLGKIFAVEPENLDAHEKAYLIYEAAGNQAQALEQLLNVLRLCTRLEAVDRGQPYLAKLMERSPDHPELAVFTSVLGQPEEAIHADEVSELSDAEIVIEPEEADEVGGDAPDLGEAQDLALESLEVAPDEPRAGDAALSWDEPLGEASEVDDQEAVEVSVDEIDLLPDDSLETPPQLPVEAAPGEPDPENEVAPDAEVAVEVDDPGASLSTEETLLSYESDDQEAPAPPEESGQTLAEELANDPAEEPAPIEEDLASEEVAEAEFFLDQGLLDHARETLETVLIVYPDHAAALALMGRLAELEGAPGSGELEGSIDLETASEVRLSATSDDFQYSAEDVLAEFKKGLEKVVGPHEVETHYDLGIAYKEMGLVDEAIREFEIARQACINDKREIDCLSMIALLKQQKGEPLGAVEPLKQALGSQYVTPEIRRNLEYDLGVAWEKVGKPGKALFHYQIAASLDPNYRDVSQQVARLSASTKPESDPPTSRRDARNGARLEREETAPTSGKREGDAQRPSDVRPGRVRTAAK